MKDRFLSITKAGEYLNVCNDTLRKWERKGILHVYKTAGGHRRYSLDELDRLLGVEAERQEASPETDRVAIYARVSSNEQKQKGDLDRQSQRIAEYCARNGWRVTQIIKDVGSGLNDGRCGFVRLTELVIQEKIDRLVVEHKDRLTRFQFNFIKRMFENIGCTVVVMNRSDVSDEDELATDIMSLMASFSGKFYGRRSAARRRKERRDV